MSDTVVFRGVTYHLIPGLAPCFQYDLVTEALIAYLEGMCKND